jgi:predicted Rossmann fold flavoprotein
MIDLIVIGAGAAGVFAAINARRCHPRERVVLLEKTAVPLAKVRISGGGRCNVTHSCFNPAELCRHYPRGARELLGPFHRFQPSDTVQWFQEHGVKLKTEADGRMFPVTDRSETIIECLLGEAERVGVELRLRQKIEQVQRVGTSFQVKLADGLLEAKRLLLATGSSPEGWRWAEQLGHTIVPPVPSLFTFNVPNSPLKELSGIAVDPAEVSIPDTTLSQRGPLLITHFGFSGPAALKLSAWGARELAQANYRVMLQINWLPAFNQEQIYQRLEQLKRQSPQRSMGAENPFGLARNLWRHLADDRRLQEWSLAQLRQLAQKLNQDLYQVEGKTTHKEEFVTCGGIKLQEVDFRTMQSKICPGLYFAGEVLNIDGVTGGFNFQNAWTTGYIAGTRGGDER